MSIQFDWHFDDEGDEKTASVFSSRKLEKETAKTGQSSPIADLLRRIYAHLKHRFHQAGSPDGRRRRLHAALARVRRPSS